MVECLCTESQDKSGANVFGAVFPAVLLEISEKNNRLCLKKHFPESLTKPYSPSSGCNGETLAVV